MKFKQTQQKGLSLARDEILSNLKNTTASILNAVTTNNNPSNNSNAVNNTNPQSRDPPISGNNLTLETQYYVKYRLLAAKVRPLCVELEKRANNPEYPTKKKETKIHKKFFFFFQVYRFYWRT